ncbi:MAG: hypothetical protein DWB99_04920 [Candidatus Poseidoniales archaeon]|nr:MAG: hypothetical protein DWB99_04920 [Candidatus Poseidoniales archaeon]
MLSLQQKVLISTVAVWCFIPLVIMEWSKFDDFWPYWGICVLFALSMTCLSIYRDNKLANLDTKQLAMKEPMGYQIRGLLLFLVSLVLIIEIINAIIDTPYYYYQSLFIPDAFIPDGGVFAIDPDGDSDSGGKGVRALFVWLYTTLCYGSSISFYYENRSSKMLVGVRNELMFGDSGDISSGLNSNIAITNLLAKHRDEKPEPLDRPSTYNDIMAAMESNLQKAMEVAELLQEELTQTKSRVVDLEVEVKKREEEIIQIQQYKVEMNNFIESNNENDGNGKTLSLTDSVMVGDSIMGGVKIDKQINNDPEAIARAVIEAYRSGLND